VNVDAADDLPFRQWLVACSAHGRDMAATWLLCQDGKEIASYKYSRPGWEEDQNPRYAFWIEMYARWVSGSPVTVMWPGYSCRGKGREM